MRDKAACRKRYVAAGSGWDAMIYGHCEKEPRHSGPCGPKPPPPTPRGEPPPPPRTVNFYQPTSAAAYRGALPRESSRQYAIWGYVNERPSTTDEVEQGMGGVHQSVSAAISGMWHAKHLVHPNGEKRPTAQSTPGHVFMAEVYQTGLTCCPVGRNCWECPDCLERDTTKSAERRDALRASHRALEPAVQMRLLLVG